MEAELLRQIAISLPQVIEAPHFNKTSFRVKKKIFATYDSKTKQMCIKLNDVYQVVFVAIGKESIYPVPNKWGKIGWTIIETAELHEEIIKDALTCAYCTVAPTDLAATFIKAEQE